MNHELQEAIRLMSRATNGSPWTGQLEKSEVMRASSKLIQVAEKLDRENEELKRSSKRP